MKWRRKHKLSICQNSNARFDFFFFSFSSVASKIEKKKFTTNYLEMSTFQTYFSFFPYFFFVRNAITPNPIQSNKIADKHKFPHRARTNMGYWNKNCLKMEMYRISFVQWLISTHAFFSLRIYYKFCQIHTNYVELLNLFFTHTFWSWFCCCCCPDLLLIF